MTGVRQSQVSGFESGLGQSACADHRDARAIRHQGVAQGLSVNMEVSSFPLRMPMLRSIVIPLNVGPAVMILGPRMVTSQPP